MEFTYSNYKILLKSIIDTGKYMDYSVVNNSIPNFIVLRHDIEFSLKKALIMSEIEKQFGIVSSYFIQIQNDFYNALSNESIKIIQQINANNHYIGLHYHLSNKNSFDFSEISNEIQRQCGVLSQFLNIPITRFSIHKPTEQILKNTIKIKNIINTYDPLYFTYIPNFETKFENEINVKYYADSSIKWKYGIPTKKNFEKFNRIQILIHPYSWYSSKKTYDEISELTIADRVKEIITIYEKEQK